MLFLPRSRIRVKPSQKMNRKQREQPHRPYKKTVVKPKIPHLTNCTCWTPAQGVFRRTATVNRNRVVAVERTAEAKQEALEALNCQLEAISQFDFFFANVLVSIWTRAKRHCPRRCVDTTHQHFTIDDTSNRTFLVVKYTFCVTVHLQPTMSVTCWTRFFHDLRNRVVSQRPSSGRVSWYSISQFCLPLA